MKLNDLMTDAPTVSGGYVFSRDKPDPGNVTFATALVNSTTSGGTVSVAPGMMPLTTVISNTASYTFTGEAIGGGSLTCSGTGTIDLRCSPTHFTSVVVNRSSAMPAA